MKVLFNTSLPTLAPDIINVERIRSSTGLRVGPEGTDLVKRGRAPIVGVFSSDADNGRYPIRVCCAID